MFERKIAITATMLTVPPLRILTPIAQHRQPWIVYEIVGGEAFTHLILVPVGHKIESNVRRYEFSVSDDNHTYWISFPTTEFDELRQAGWFRRWGTDIAVRYVSR